MKGKKARSGVVARRRSAHGETMSPNQAKPNQKRRRRFRVLFTGTRWVFEVLIPCCPVREPPVQFRKNRTSPRLIFSTTPEELLFREPPVPVCKNRTPPRLILSTTSSLRTSAFGFHFFLKSLKILHIFVIYIFIHYVNK
jgi:hypothetical protein